MSDWHAGRSPLRPERDRVQQRTAWNRPASGSTPSPRPPAARIAASTLSPAAHNPPVSSRLTCALAYGPPRRLKPRGQFVSPRNVATFAEFSISCGQARAFSCSRNMPRKITDEQLNEAKRLIAGDENTPGISRRAAAKQVGVSESTLRCALERPTSAPPQLSEAELSPPEKHSMDQTGVDWNQAMKPAIEHERRQREKFARENPYHFRLRND